VTRRSARPQHQLGYSRRIRIVIDDEHVSIRRSGTSLES